MVQQKEHFDLNALFDKFSSIISPMYQDLNEMLKEANFELGRGKIIIEVDLRKRIRFPVVYCDIQSDQIASVFIREYSSAAGIGKISKILVDIGFAKENAERDAKDVCMFLCELFNSSVFPHNEHPLINEKALVTINDREFQEILDNIDESAYWYKLKARRNLKELITTVLGESKPFKTTIYDYNTIETNQLVVANWIDDERTKANYIFILTFLLPNLGYDTDCFHVLTLKLIDVPYIEQKRRAVYLVDRINALECDH